MSDQAPTTCTLVGFGTIATHTSQRRKKTEHCWFRLKEGWMAGR